jgi:nucleoid DNA-binding protein
VGAMSTATIDNPVKSIILTFFISITTSINLLNGMVLVGFGKFSPLLGFCRSNMK